MVLKPGETVQLHARLFDAAGRFLHEDKAAWSLDKLSGNVSDGKFTTASSGPGEAGLIKATVGEITGEARARVMAVLLLASRGTPFLYYGEEIGMGDAAIPPERICDPVGKRFPSLGRDPERSPMQWDGSPTAGFTEAADPVVLASSKSKSVWCI
jgi:glycosidase